MTVTGILIVLVVVAAVFAIMALRRLGDAASPDVLVRADVTRPGGSALTEQTPAAIPTAERVDAQAAAAAAPAGAATAEPNAQFAVRWPSRVAPRAAPLDEEARAHLLADLALLRASWCVPILAEAYAEESSPALRRAALSALSALSTSDEARRILAGIAATGDGDERAIAAAALAEAQPVVESSPTIR